MLFYLIHKKNDSKDIPNIKLSFSTKIESESSSNDIWKFLLLNIDKYFEEDMIDFYIGLVDQDCSKEFSDDLTFKEIKTLKKTDLNEFIDYIEGSNDDSFIDSYYLISEKSREYNMLNKMKLIKKDKKIEVIEI
jgi:DNA polymerase III delta prime subunit